jgi:glucosamine-6-phosphate deaminase
MGGMLDVLAQNENDITVAYMTNGSVAVFDADVQRYLHFLQMSTEALGLGEEATQCIEKTRKDISTFSAERAGDDVDPEQLQVLKAHVRYSEAVAAIGVMGLQASSARFLDMPFYKTGRIKKDPIGESDVDVVLSLLREIQPAHIFVAGDLSDPHGTHRMCYQAIKEAVARYRTQAKGGEVASDKEAGEEGASEAELQRTETPPLSVWLYRGAWQEWETHRADLFLPLSKAALDRKVEAIFKHESQKDRAMFPGAYDEREFWQRARDRNRETANTLNELGLPEFYAAEAYVVTDEMP